MSRHDDRGVLFDLDGTLLNTAPDLTGAVNELRVERGLQELPQTTLSPMCSYGARGMLMAGLDMQQGDAEYDAARARFLELYRARMTRETRPYAGMRELVAAIVDSGWRWGIVTNKAKALAGPIVEAMAFDPAPACVVGGDEVPELKPDPRSILLACERAGLEPSRCIYIGDSARDMKAGQAAGMPTIAVGYGYIPVDEPIEGWPATRVAHTVAELKTTIRELQQESKPA